MESNQNFNPEHIKTAGEKIQRCVTYIVLQVILSIIFGFIGFILSQSNQSSFFGIGLIFSIVILGLGITSLYNLSESGNFLIKSVSKGRISEFRENIEVVPKEEESVSNPVNPDEKLFEEFDENGKLKIKGMIKNEKREGVWEFYYSNSLKGDFVIKKKYEGGKEI